MKRALFSVYNKDYVDDLAAFLVGQGWEIISTGGTAKHLQSKNIPVTDVSAVTKFPECLDGRVKTLHPGIHAGLLARRDVAEHLKTLKDLAIEPIDLVCVNLYPFFEKAQEGLSLEETVEFIDIGGPSMLRSAAKNFKDVIALTDPADYAPVIAALQNAGPNETAPDFATRKALAAKVFTLTSAYDGAIARYLLELDAVNPEALGTGDSAENATDYPEFWPFSVRKAQSLRYGENSHQSAALYINTAYPGALGSMEQLNGRELSYNNIKDLDMAWKAASAFGFPAAGIPPTGAADMAALGLAAPPLRPACVAVKHNTPCGIAQGATLLEAYEKTYYCDPVSIYGGIVACNVMVDGATAEKLSDLFLEIVVAPDFSQEALEILSTKKNLRVLRISQGANEQRETISVDGGILVQERDRNLFDKWDVVTKTAILPEDIPDLAFGMRAVTFVKSNAILIAKNSAATGIGGGETNRIWAAEMALDRSKKAVEAAAAAGISDSSPARVLASDAFFPFRDVVEAAAEAGIRSIVQPGGSQNDQESIDACDELGIAMVFTGLRHFKH